LDALIRGFDRSSDSAAFLLRLVVDDLPDELRAERAAELVGVFPDARAALGAMARDADEVVSMLSARALARLGSVPAPAPTLSVLAERPA
jgi:hypothetical protein